MSHWEEAFVSFATYASLVILKMMAIGPITSYYRIRYKIFENEEDASGKKLIYDHPLVNRALRCNRNDLENIVPFVILGGLFAGFSGAPLSTIVWHYRVFVAARFFHSVAYLLPLPQPCRGLGYLIGFFTNASMAVRLVLHNWAL